MHHSLCALFDIVFVRIHVCMFKLHQACLIQIQKYNKYMRNNIYIYAYLHVHVTWTQNNKNDRTNTTIIKKKTITTNNQQKCVNIYIYT